VLGHDVHDNSDLQLNGYLELLVAQRSVAGRKPENEDCVGYYCPDGTTLTTKGAVALIADGVSSAEAGKEASQTCIREFLNDYFDTPDSWTVKKSAQKIFTALNRLLYSKGHQYLEAEKGYICTLSTLIIKSRTAHLFHIGDSRIYRLQQGSLECLTRDHFVQISKDRTHLIRAMGMDTGLDIDYRQLDVAEGDVFLLTTDGIHDYVSLATMERVLNACPNDWDRACQELITLAEHAESPDNLSCLVLEVVGLADDSVDDLTHKLTRLPFPPELTPGMKIDGYRVERELYASSRSQLYLVKEMATGQSLVMKTPSVNFEDDPAYLERFIMEEWVGSRIDSPHVVKVIKQKQSRNFLYYLMEYIEGETLQVWMERHPDPSPKEAIRLVDELVQALESFHRKETIHQDLKPGNIMVGTEGHVTVVDFGSVYVAGIDEIFIPIERDRILGTIDYSDPAYRLGQYSGIKGDLYSLGSIVYELFTGHLPYGSKLGRCSKPEHYRRLIYRPSSRYNPIIPGWFDRALEKAVKIDPAERYGSLKYFLHDLRTPNPEFLTESAKPLVTRNPMLLWKILSGFWLASLIFVLLLFWLQG
jgi:protein phosphatase